MVEVNLSSGRVASIRELSAREQMNADAISKGDSVKIAYYRTVMSLAKLGKMVDGEFKGEEFAPAASDLDLETRIDMLTGREFDEIGVAYITNFSPMAETLKNA